MERKLSSRCPSRTSHPRRFGAVGLALLFVVGLGGTAWAQQTVTGTVSTAGHVPLAGVTVAVSGTEVHTLTNSRGRYSIDAPSTGALTFTLLGYRRQAIPVNGRTTIDVTMEHIAMLEQVVVTGYGTERRADITGAVASVPVEAISRPTTASVLQRLNADAPGVTVDAAGAPGSRSTVRIRGISSFQNNDPLYIVDGTPVQDTYVNFLNPDDITSVQVLKDASAASIYGSRASNGVIIITTTHQGVSAPRATLSVRTGMSNPTNSLSNILITNALDYAKVLKASYTNAGTPVPTNIYGDPNNPTIPKYIYAAPSTVTSYDQWGRPATVDVSKYSYPYNLIMPGSQGTDWFKTVFGTGHVNDANLNIAGGGTDNRYNVSFGYFDQNGTAVYNDYRRGSIRANTDFTRGKVGFGENMSLSTEQQYGGYGLTSDNQGEDGLLGKDVMMQPVIPVYDIQHNFAGGKAPTLGNQSNPLHRAFWTKDNVNHNNRVFGNIYGDYNPLQALALKSSLGFDLGEGQFTGINSPYPENAEATYQYSMNDNQNQWTNWTWSNTANYSKKLGDHNFTVLAGEEANGSTSRGIYGSLNSLLNTDVNSRYIQDALGDSKSKNVSSSGSASALLSLFTKVDYNYAEKYVASVTVRRDGSSNLAPGHQWGTFPAFGLGWHISNENFLKNSHIFSDVMIRYGYGITGNQLIPSGRIVAQYGGGTGDTYYDIGGTQQSIVAGFRQTALGNPDLRWEQDKSQNIGTDMSLFDRNIDFVLDVYSRSTDNLLYNPAIPTTAGIASPPIVNVGEMSNKGFDFSIGHHAANWNITFNGSHYANRIDRINGQQKFFYGPVSTREGNQVINMVGQPIGSFYGYVAQGYFKDAADAAAHTPDANGKCTAYCQTGAAPGRIKFKDVNGDGQITLADRQIIGSPLPKFTAGLDMGVRRGNWDLNATVFGTYGNKIFENQMEWYVFREFNTNVRKDLLANSWTPTHQNAKYPIIDNSDNYSRQISSYYVKDGSYTRLQNIQLGYNLPSTSRYLSAARVYVQADNLFTITGYDGLDPALAPQNVTGAAGDIRDQYRGVDRGSYPSSRIFSIGVTTSF